MSESLKTGDDEDLSRVDEQYQIFTPYVWSLRTVLSSNENPPEHPEGSVSRISSFYTKRKRGKGAPLAPFPIVAVPCLPHAVPAPICRSSIWVVVIQQCRDCT